MPKTLLSCAYPIIPRVLFKQQQDIWYSCHDADDNINIVLKIHRGDWCLADLISNIQPLKPPLFPGFRAFVMTADRGALRTGSFLLIVILYYNFD